MAQELIWAGTANTTHAAPEGDCLNLTDRVSYTEVRHGRLEEVTGYAWIRPKGTTATFTVPGTTSVNWIVDEARVTKSTSGRGTATISWVALATPPPATYAMLPFETSPALARHPMFASLTAADLEAANIYLNASNLHFRASFTAKINKLTNKDLVWDYIAKRDRGQETFYAVGIKYAYTYYLYTPPSLTMGGYIETPTHPTGGSWPATMSWLRAADESAHENGIFKVTKTWLGGDAGYWDPEIYPTA